MIVKRSDMDGFTKEMNCCKCGKNMDEWMDIIGFSGEETPGFALCKDCAKVLLRLTMEDVIKWNNQENMKHGRLTLQGIIDTE